MTLRVLLVEDDADVRVMVRWALEAEDMEVHESATSQEALALVGEHGADFFDVAVIDLMLHGSELSGNILADVLRKIVSHVVIVTAAPYLLEKIDLPPSVVVVPKPFEADDLRKAIHDGT